jgi:hypothetical protein
MITKDQDVLDDFQREKDASKCHIITKKQYQNPTVLHKMMLTASSRKRIIN